MTSFLPIIYRRLAVPLALVGVAVSVCAASASRQRQLLDGIWSFSLQEANSDHYPEADFDDSAWRKVQLPHDYVVELGFDRHGDSSHGFRPKPVAWYRRSFTAAPDPGGREWLEFDGVYRNCTVWLNGHKLGGHQSGYTSFYFDVTPYLVARGANKIAVRVDPSANEGWWYEGGGIYRHVWLTKVSPIHIAHWGTFVTTPVVQTEKAQVRAQIEIQNEDGEAADVTIESSVLRGRSVVAKEKNFLHLGSSTTRLSQDLSVSNPQLWSLESPNRYVLVTVIKRGEKELDRYETPFGIRTIRFDPDKGFFLNGKHVEIKGTANHQDFAAVGVAVPDNLQRFRIQRLQSMGCNAYRSSHNPPNPELLDICDELGMLVLDENRHPGDTFESKVGNQTRFDDMSEVDSMVLRDRNHPCVIGWSLANEEWAIQTTAFGVRMLTAVNNRVKTLDPTRPTAVAFGGGAQNGNSPNLRDVVDLTGANYGPESYDYFHRQFSQKPLVATEFSALSTTRGIYENDPTRGYVTSLPEELTGANFKWMRPQDISWEAIAARPFVAGGFVWTGFDYRGEPTPYQWPYDWPDVIGSWGQMDLCGFPKDAYYYFQSAWGAETRPVVHVFPQWNWPGDEGKLKKVCVYTNADEVELFLNGKSVGARKHLTKNLHVEWSIPYAPGTLVAKGFQGGKPFGQDAVETTGNAVAMKLRTLTHGPTSDPETLFCVEVGLTDAKGRFVPNANEALSFSITGPASLVGAGNGDPSDHDPESTASLTATHFTYRAFNGRAIVVLRPTGQSAAIELTVEGPGLKSAHVVVK